MLFRSELGAYRAGQFVRYEDGSAHSPVALAEDGAQTCVLFALSHEGIALLD